MIRNFILSTLILVSQVTHSCEELPWLPKVEELNKDITERINFDEIKAISQSAREEIVVAVIGDGVNPKDFPGALALNKKEIPDNGIDDDNNGIVDDYYGVNFSVGHGTDFSEVGFHEMFVSSLVTTISGSRCENDYRVKVLPLKITTGDNHFDDLYVKKLADAIDYAVLRGARVINMSLGVSRDYKSFFRFVDNDVQKSLKYLTDAIDRAYQKNVVLMGASSNNNNRDQTLDPNYPADLKHVISVTSVNLNHEIKRAYGRIIMTAFYGEEIFGLAGDGNIIRSTGTSFATPMIAATIALALSIRPWLTVDEIRDMVIKASTQKINGRRQIRNGVFSPLKFLQMLD